MHAQILGNQINNTILLKHKLERTDKRVENNKLYIYCQTKWERKKNILFFSEITRRGKEEEEIVSIWKA